MGAPINYSANSWLPFRFVQHAVFGLQHNTNIAHVKNWREKFGDIGLWGMENVPGKMWKVIKEPRVVNIAVAALAMTAVSLAFYPVKTKQVFTDIVKSIPLPTREQVKFAAYLTIIAHIASFALRAEGRFSNNDLMNAWYGKFTSVAAYLAAAPRV